MKKDLAILISWIVRYSMLIVVFLFFPVFVFFLAKNYEHKALYVLETTSTSTNSLLKKRLLSEESDTLTQDAASKLQDINGSIQGDWVNPQDDTYLLNVKADNTFDEFYKKEKFGWGTWRAYSASSSVYIKRVQLDPDSKGEEYTYQIYQLTDSNLVLVRVDNDKILSFVRPIVTSTTTATSSKK